MKKRIDEEQEEMPRWDLEDLSEAVATLKRGGLILYPTDTIWGIGCDATNAEAVSRIFALKQRDDAKALLSIVSSDGMLAQVVRTIPDIAYDMMDTATKPLTIIYPDAVGLALNLLAEDGSAGIRVVGDLLCSLHLSDHLYFASQSQLDDVGGHMFRLLLLAIPHDVVNSIAHFICDIRKGRRRWLTGDIR